MECKEIFKGDARLAGEPTFNVNDVSNLSILVPTVIINYQKIINTVFVFTRKNTSEYVAVNL